MISRSGLRLKGKFNTNYNYYFIEFIKSPLFLSLSLSLSLPPSSHVMHRYKDLSDIIKEGKLKGTHTPEDDILMHKKAHAIVNCYIDSAVSPRVQVSYSQLYIVAAS